MSKNVLIISTSLRSGSNSDALAKAFAEGARSAGNNVEEISLRGKSIAFCRSCLACRELGRCVINDDANAIVEKMLHADVIAFATPIYYYEMSGQLKTLLDRAKEVYADDMTESHGGLFGLGKPNDAYAQYFVGQSYLNPLTDPSKTVFLANVTFEPGCRNNWHIHNAESGGGQLLICVDGVGCSNDWCEPVSDEEYNKL